jgi:hypothetical protein
MIIFRKTFILLFLCSAVVFTGCELVNEDQPAAKSSPANHVVINEVFTLPADHPSSYSWIEFFNPTADTVDLTHWSLEFGSYRFSIIDTSRWRAQYSDSPRVFTEFAVQHVGTRVIADPYDVYEVPLVTTSNLVMNQHGAYQIEDTGITLLPGGLLTIVNNEQRLLDHSDWGPAGENNRFVMPQLVGPFDDVQVITENPDTTYRVIIFQRAYVFRINPTEQLILRDGVGQIRDVVRIGNFVYSGPVTHPLLGADNKSLGMISEFNAAFRFAGGYFTGNTGNDFGITQTPRSVPTPHGWNPVYKQ